MDINEQWHWFKIEVREKRTLPVTIRLFWDRMTFENRIKWDWYFKYRAALLQVQNPRMIVDSSWGHTPITEKEALTKFRQNKIVAKKRKVTEIQNKLRMAENTWSMLFPIQDDPTYKKAVDKLTRTIHELKQLQDAEI